MLSRVLTFILSIVFSYSVYAQRPAHSLLYEVSGNGLKKPSYLFGTFHLLTESFVDSQKNVIKAFRSCKAVAGEVITDSMASPKVLEAMQADTPINKLISDSSYDDLNDWMQELMGMDMTLFNNFSPMAVNAVLLNALYNKHFDPPAGEQLMDIYFQQLARKRKMNVYGLESIQTQIDALFETPLTQQAKHLEELVREKDSAVYQLRELMRLYRTADFDELSKMMYDESFSRDEIEILVNDRNDAWVKKLPSMLSQQPTFVAVGAMHLAGENGLVEQLRKQGYTVKPLPPR